VSGEKENKWKCRIKNGIADFKVTCEQSLHSMDRRWPILIRMTIIAFSLKFENDFKNNPRSKGFKTAA
jgi:hypothetical protein